MTKTPKGYMKRPQGADHVAPQAVLSLMGATEDALGPEAAARLLRDGALFRLPDPTTPVSEEQVARMHKALRIAYPVDAAPIARVAGRRAAESLIETQLSPRAQRMLSASPWTVGAWLLGRWAGQHAWTFAGSGRFRMVREMEFVIWDNPFAKAAAPAEGPQCAWQEALFERLFQSLIDPRLICREMTCAAAGADACRFAFMLREGAEGTEP